MLFFGDLLQLSPVSPDCPLVTLKAEQLVKYHESLVTDINLWADLFSYDELSINVRQQSDYEFADMLSRIRVGMINKADERRLRERQYQFRSRDQKGKLKEFITFLNSLPPNSVCLLPTNAQCSVLNSGMLANLPSEDIVIKCKDTIDSRNNVQREQAVKYLKKLDKDNTRTGALEDTLIIKIGCKVMLRRNMIELTVISD